MVRQVLVAMLLVLATLGVTPACAAGDDRAVAAYKARQDAIEKALDAGKTEDAIALSRAHLGQAERDFGAESEAVLVALDDLSEVLSRARRSEERIAVQEQALRAAIALYGENDARVGGYLRMLGVVLTHAGRDVDAEPWLVRALGLRERLLTKDHPDVLASVTDLALIWHRLDRFADALRLTDRAIALQHGGKRPDLMLRLLENRADILEELGRKEEARAAYATAYDARLKADGKDAADASEAAHGRVNMCFGDDFPPECEALALNVYQARRKLFGDGAEDTITAQKNLAAVYMGLRKFDQSDAVMSQVLALYGKRLGPTHEKTGMENWSLAYLRLASKVRASDALDPARVAVAVERAGRGAPGASAAAQAAAAASDDHGYAEFVTLADAAWSAVQSGKAAAGALDDEAFAALQDAVAGAADQAASATAVRVVAERRSPAIGELVRSRQDLARQWQELTDKLSALLASEDGDTAMLRNVTLIHRTTVEAHMTGLDARLRAEFPDYFGLIRPEALSIAETQALLADDEAILLAVPSHFGIHIAAISRTGFKWQRAALSMAKLGGMVQRLLFDLGGTVDIDNATAERWLDQGGNGYPFDRKTAFRLYQELVAPLAPVIAGKRHLFIASAGSLTALPFGVLVTEAPQGEDGDANALRATRWLADKHAISVIPSVRALKNLREPGRAARPMLRFAGFGDPLLNGPDQCATTRSASAARRGVPLARLLVGQRRSGGAIANIAELRKMGRLPCTARELEAMRVRLNAPESSVHLQRGATETAVKAADLGGLRVLALATHGLLAGEVDGLAEPGLVMTPPDTATAEDDGYLAASEIAALKLAVDWVILSACNTGGGDGSEGAPGLSGLARAFFFAGARNLLVSHWPVRDNVAPLLTVATVMPEGDGLRSRAEALQAAQRAVRLDATHDGINDRKMFDTWAHPNAWAPFSLVGDGAR